jgi:hypothetical protein
MATNPNEFDDNLRRIEDLSDEQRNVLLDRLSRQRAALNGNNSRRSVLDAFLDRGLADSLKGAPPDASTNREYMEGFGQGAE